MAPLRVSNAPSPIAPEERTSLYAVRAQAEQLLDNPIGRAILDALPGYALVLTRQRKLVAAQGGALEELGLTSPERLRALRAGELFRCVPVRDGFSRSRQFWVTTTPLRLGCHELILFLFKDIGDQKRRDTLDQVFLHDLLNLAGGLEGIARSLASPGADPAAVALQIQELHRQMAEQVQNHSILFSAGVDGRLAERRETRPGEILDRLRAFCATCPAADGRRVEILDGPGDPFVCDPTLLARILVNLVKNALEATPPGGCVKVWQERREGRRGFLVENPGLVPAETGGRIFERSFSTKDGQGRGLGAYGAKLLGEQLLGGEVGFTSRDGASTRFYIWIPEGGPCRASAPAQAAEDRLPRCPAPEGADTLLVVDDSSTLCGLLGNLLCPRYRVLTAETGEDGLTLAVQCKPDLILLDIMMPDMDGFAVCRQLKADSRTRDIPVLFLTALGGEAEEMRALESGGIDFILKPVSPPVLAARVRNQLELKHHQDRLRNLSLLDGLTGIANRRRFDQYLDLEWQRCSRNGQPLSLVMGDVDFFKAYNDGYGHGQGDECLRAVAKVFAMALRRPADLAARYGGEEFVCLLPETDQEGARNVADQVQAQMADLALPHAYSSVCGRVTVSVGVATAVHPTPGWPGRGLVEEADARLYEAKARGRNRVEGPALNLGGL